MNIRNTVFSLVTRRYYNVRRACELALPHPLLDLVYRMTNPAIADRAAYRPYFAPYLADGEFRSLVRLIRPRSLVAEAQLWVLYSMALQSLHVPGEYFEAGVYKGGTARLLHEVLRRERGPRTPRTLRLFDTFAGMPSVDRRADLHKQGDFQDTSLESVSGWIGHDGVTYHEGLIPETFVGLPDSPIAFAHVDVDIKASVMECCRFIYPRLSPGGVMIFDDYGQPSCPGARAAVDEFFAAKPERVLSLPAGQALVTRLPAHA